MNVINPDSKKNVMDQYETDIEITKAGVTVMLRMLIILLRILYSDVVLGNPFTAGIDFRCQNLLKSTPALKELKYL